MIDERPHFTMVDGVRMRDEVVWLTPGKHVARTNRATLPSPDNTRSAVDSAPPVEYMFEAGATYALECKGNSLDLGPIDY